MLAVTLQRTHVPLVLTRSVRHCHFAANNIPLDMVCIDFKDPAKLTEEAEEGARMGFTGKQAIHPAQVKIICDSFKPPEVR